MTGARDLCHPETVRVAAGHQAEARKIAAELAAIARTGMVLPGSITERRTRCGHRQLRLPRRPAPPARPLLAVDPQGRRQNHLPLAQRRPAPRLPGLDRQRPAAARPAHPARSPRRRRPRRRPALAAQPPGQPPATPARPPHNTVGTAPLNLWPSPQPARILPAQAKREDLNVNWAAKPRPFSLDFVLLPVRDDQVRAIGPDRYLIPERLHDGPRWPELLRALLIPRA